MESAAKFLLVLVTAPSLTVSRKLATAVLKARLAACANIVPKVESHYWWQGKLESSAELLLIFKTTADKAAALEQAIKSNHPYDTPEIIALELTKGNKRYLEWIKSSVTAE